MDAAPLLKVTRYLMLPVEIAYRAGFGDSTCYVVREVREHDRGAWGVMLASELAPILFADWRN